MPIDLKKYNHPFDEVIETADKLAKEGGLCYQKWTCAGCGDRLMSEKPNVFSETGKCDNCGHITNLRETGCNYLLALSAGKHAPT